MNRIWRFFATLLGFIIFGFFGLLFSLFFLVLAIFSHNNYRLQLISRRFNARVWAIFIKYMVASGILTLNFRGASRLGQPGQLILSNHPSLIDVLFIVAAAPEINCVVKNDLKKNPIMAGAIAACGYLPNKDPLELIETSEKILSHQSLLIFPEGTRTGWDGKIKLNRGAVAIGLRSAKKITPVVIKMRPPNFKKGQPWYKIPRRKISCDITVMDDIYPESYLDSKPLPIAARILNDQLEQLFQRNS